MYVFHWSPEIRDHIEQHGVMVDEFELTVNSPDDLLESRSSGDPLAKRWFGDRWIYCVYRLVNEFEVEPVTAFQVWD